MNWKRLLATVIFTTTLMFVAAFLYHEQAALSAQSSTNEGAEKISMAGQIKELQKQVAELHARAREPRIVAGGTATYTRPEYQDNRINVLVKLPAEVTEKLGEDYIVLLTSRFPVGGFPYFAAYWKKAALGFEITVVDTTISWGSKTAYANKNKDYLVDWIVVKK
jgi:hypothetical protein